ncbi:MAG: cystathionine gamma-lyase [Chloroflexi bacterium]|uniref:Cystathionine gamma-lyase n=1 Tax=Candidatus Chlorohelix allophototropha TaxID=3003348 RepID=A0A8T7M9K5_9CHLR|nr:cystathionine gamma-lyase [Chloroflexota bacterium]WJW68552.1 cystathionine gamma-lyase [Chloroflexota bacterium L227-S17]
MYDATRVTRAGVPEAVQGEAFLQGPVFASAFHAAGDPSAVPYTYARFNNPTWNQFEQALSELEGGEAVVFPSGMAAVASIFGTLLRPGDTLVLPSDSYYTSRVIAQGYLAEMGVRVQLASTRGNAQLAHLEGAKLLWLESPSNPGLEVCDIRMLAEAAHAQGVLVAVDNTTPTMLGQKPLELGADFSVASATKALTGHSDLVLGYVAAKDSTLLSKVRAWRTQQGAIPGPMEVWMAHRSLGTLALRLERQCNNALAIAHFLSRRPEVLEVRYPGLPEDPAHSIAVRQMSYYGPVVSFTLASREQAEKFLANCKLVYEATSFGGLHTSAERRARWSGDIISEGFIRFSAGCEDIRDLLADLEQALATLS